MVNRYTSPSREDIYIWLEKDEGFNLTLFQAEECQSVVDSLLTVLQKQKIENKIEISAYPIFFTEQDDFFYKKKICQLLKCHTNIHVEYYGMKLIIRENLKRSHTIAYTCYPFSLVNPSSDSMKKKVARVDVDSDWMDEFNKEPSKYVINFPFMLIDSAKKNNADLFCTCHSIYDFYEKEIENFDFSKRFSLFHLDDLRLLDAQVKKIDFTSSLINQIQKTLLKHRERWFQQLMKKLSTPPFVLTKDNLIFLQEVIQADQIQVKPYLDSKVACEYLDIISQKIASYTKKINL